jgi:alpha/beta superfamily hydrolase
MHNKVVFRAAKSALLAGLPTLRFNFRGAGHSAGTFTGGEGEREDVRAALSHLTAHFPGLPVCLMGFSFGAWVGLEVGAADSRVSTLVGLGVPVNMSNFDFLLDVRKPKLILQGTRDEFGSVAKVSALYDSLAEPKQIHWVEGADHFFAGRLDEVQKVLQQFLAPLSGEVQPA